VNSQLIGHIFSLSAKTMFIQSLMASSEMNNIT